VLCAVLVQVVKDDKAIITYNQGIQGSSRQEKKKKEKGKSGGGAKTGGGGGGGQKKGPPPQKKNPKNRAGTRRAKWAKNCSLWLTQAHKTSSRRVDRGR
jgi:hypothetical protein